MKQDFVMSLLVVAIGAAATTFTALFVSRSRQQHERWQTVAERKSQLLQGVASKLGTYFVRPIAFAHVASLFQGGRADEWRLTQSVEELADGQAQLADAMYVASLVGQPELNDALSSYWDAANALYCEVRRSGTLLVEDRIQPLIDALSEQSQRLRIVLGRAYGHL